ncbi:purine-cytosine permease family protein [Clavibacter sepedonicus]|uniref:Purine permease n=1 Tax=Clavibacter sepedonicus TaxID=31964 RepID=B0RB01_CLASE|nr:MULTISPECIES: cytosine permease [Clavibacter]MBD5380660.1 cytosine permease [Clavibacter sp.]OQJ48376.1 cytosine permease [Clavibacter sepedonicus]OQJ53858.1 cytosine permease [Clavibacter sepedonicus]CAQ02848.1 putative purine permease [Clavibacter sepedonicus]
MASTAPDDYALARVPQEARYHWFPIATQRVGQLSALSAFVVAATLGFSMSFWDAFWAITIGAVILEVVCIFTGLIGMREGLNTSVLSRWTGFGHNGSALIGLAVGISLIGWFGIQSGVSASGLNSIMPWLPVWAWSLAFGLIITAVVMLGFHGMQWVANVAVPLFLLLVGWAVVIELQKHDISELVTQSAPGPQMSIIAGASIVAGGFIVGALISPDQTRYNRSAADVVKQTIVSITVGEYLTGLSGVLLAHAVRTADVSAIILSSVGWVGVLVILLGTIKINDWNLYSSGLGIVNFIDTVFGRRVNRALVTVVVGVLAAAGILGQFTAFLTLLGVAFPPIVGIMIAEYFVVKNWRPALDASRENGALPASAPRWVPVSLAIWVVSALVGYFATFGLGSLNAVITAFVLYAVLGKAGLIRGVGEVCTEAVAQPAPGVAAPDAATAGKVATR